MLSRMHNGYCYPQLILPDELAVRLNQCFIRGKKFGKAKDGIYLQDLISEAKKIDYKCADIEYLVPPFYPEPPKINIVSETKTIHYTNYHLGCWVTVLIIIVIIAISLADVFGGIGAGFLYALSFTPIFIYMLNGFDAIKGTPDSKEVKRSVKEINQLKKEAKEDYEKRMQLYREAKQSYGTRLDNYTLTQRANMARIESIIDKIFWNLNGKFRAEIHVFPERANEVPQRGRSENRLFARLMEKMPHYVKIDMQVGRYYPDICIIEPGEFAIDIEVDEPYSIGSKLETHYIGCGDEHRNETFADNGWFVLRFSEEQVITQTDKCVEIIESLVSFLRYGKYESLRKMYDLTQILATPRWSKEQARLLAIKDSRELY